MAIETGTALIPDEDVIRDRLVRLVAEARLLKAQLKISQDWRREQERLQQRQGLLAGQEGNTRAS